VSTHSVVTDVLYSHHEGGSNINMCVLLKAQSDGGGCQHHPIRRLRVHRPGGEQPGLPAVRMGDDRQQFGRCAYPRALPPPMSAKRTWITTAVVAALAGSAGAGYAALGDSSAGSPSASSSPAPGTSGARPSPTEPPVSAVPASISQRFSLFRGPVDKAPDAAFLVEGAAPTLARHMPVSFRGAAWAAPSRDGVCVALQRDTGIITGCSNEAATTSGLTAVTSTADGETAIVGLVPDGVARVTLVSGDGSERVLPVASNTYSAMVPGTTDHVSFVTDDGRATTVPIKSIAG